MAIACSSVLLGACGGTSGASTMSGQLPVANQGCATSKTTTISVSSTSKVRQLGPGFYQVFLTVDSLARCILLYVPPNPAVKSRPLILVYHGALDTAASTLQGTDFQQVAQKTGQVVAFMQGYADTWNDGAGATDAERAHVNDVLYTQVAIADLKRLVTFDAKRVVAAGFSNGALLAEYLGCELAGQLTLIVPVEGQLPATISPTCKPSRPISVYEVHGTNDGAIPYWGGTFTGVDGAVITVLSAPASVARWAQLDKCDTKPITTYPSQSIMLTTYGYCKSESVAVLRTIYGGGHEWGSNIDQLIADVTPAS
jgi:polyhydroxybutyrate depolymerase